MHVSTDKIVAAGSIPYMTYMVETGDLSHILTLERDLTPPNPTDLQSPPHFLL